MGWIETNWEYLQKFPGFVIWGDMDEAGEKFRRETCKRLGEDRCRYVEYDAGGDKRFKDANGILKNKGMKMLIAILEKRCRSYPLEGGILLGDVPDEDPTDYSNNVPTGIRGIDEVLIDPRQSQVVLFSGGRGVGKSTILGQIALNAVAEGKKTMIYSGEMDTGTVRQWLYNQATQNHMYCTAVPVKYDNVIYAPNDGIKPYISNAIDNNIIIFDNNILAKDNPPKILDVLESHVRRFGVNVLIIDNLLSSDFYRYGPSGQKNEQEIGFVKAIISLAIRMNVLIYAVAHPRKRMSGAA